MDLKAVFRWWDIEMAVLLVGNSDRLGRGSRPRMDLVEAGDEAAPTLCPLEIVQRKRKMVLEIPDGRDAS